MAAAGQGDCGVTGATEPELGQVRQGGGNRGNAGATAASRGGGWSRQGDQTWGRDGAG